MGKINISAYRWNYPIRNRRRGAAAVCVYSRGPYHHHWRDTDAVGRVSVRSASKYWRRQWRAGATRRTSSPRARAEAIKMRSVISNLHFILT